MKIAKFAALSLLAILAGGCASSGAVDGVRRDLNESKNRIYNLERELTSAREGEKSFRSDFTALRRADADLQANFDSLKGSMQSVTGRMEELEHLIKRQNEDNDRRIAALEDQVVKLQMALNLDGSTGEAASPDNLYLKGLSAFRAGEMTSARTAFNQFIAQYSSHELVSNAKYWIGETYYGDKNYEQAILEFQEVIKHYPKTEKAPAAMFKQALAFRAIKDTKSTQYLLKRLIADYPKSEEAAKAKQLQKEIK